MAKIFGYEDYEVVIEAPDNCDFPNDETKRLYEHVYGRVQPGQYEPSIDSDDFSAAGSSNDLLVAFGQNIGGKQKAPSAKATNRERLQHKFYLASFLCLYPKLSGLFSNCVMTTPLAISSAETILGENTNSDNFILIKRIIDDLNRKNWTRTQDQSEQQSGVSTLGAISERLLNIIFESMLSPNTFFKVSQSQVQSYGDFVLVCLPNNLWISVKSNFARERLLASGFSNDIIGVGFFQDPNEFTSSVKIRNFQRAGFLAMYCPDVAVTLDQVEKHTSTFEQIQNLYKESGRDMPLNINGRPFLRPLSYLKTDLEDLIQIKELANRFTVDF